MTKLIYLVLIITPFLSGEDSIYLENSRHEYLTHELLSNSEAKLSIGLKTCVGYNPCLQRIIKDSTHQLIIGLYLKQKFTNLIDGEFSPAYQYLKSKFFGEGFTSIYYFDNLLMPIALKFNFLKNSFMTLNWDIGTEFLIELNGEWELWDRDSLWGKGKIEELQKHFYLYTGLGGNVPVCSKIHIQVGSSWGYCLTTPKKYYVISNYPLRLCLGVMYLWR